MKRTNEQLYKCEVCGKVETESEMRRHEENCRKKRDKYNRQIAEFQRRRQDRLEKALSWARSSEPVMLLMQYGFEDEARMLCRDWAKWNLWDCGSSSGWEKVFTAMVESVRQEPKEGENGSHN